MNPVTQRIKQLHDEELKRKLTPQEVMANSMQEEFPSKAKLHNVEMEFHVTNDFKTKFYIYSFHTQGFPKRFLFSKNTIPEGVANEYVMPLPDNYLAYNGFDIHPYPEVARKIVDLVEHKKAMPEKWMVCPPIVNYNLNPNPRSIVESYVCEDWKVDNRLKQLFAADFFVHDMEVVEPNQVVQYAPHKLLYTNTKTGKTSMARRLGGYASRASISKLLGFSTSDISSAGTLHGNNQPWYLDEVQEEKGRQLHNQLLPVLEQGSTRIEIGKKALECDFWGSITWMSNPRKKEGYENTMVNKLVNALETICDNSGAFGSRLGMALFTNSMEQASYTPNGFDKDRMEREFIVMRQMCQTPFSKLFLERDIIKWLNTPYSEEYDNLLTTASQRVADFDLLDEFFEGMGGNYRHMRGMALRLSLLDRIPSLIHETIDKANLIDDATEKLDELQVMQVNSIKVVGALFGEDVMLKMWKSWFKRMNKENQAVLTAIIKKGEVAIMLSGLDIEWEDKPRSMMELKERLNLKQLEKFRVYGLMQKEDILFNVENLPVLKSLIE